jgi:hydroxypyruvate isomerase
VRVVIEPINRRLGIVQGGPSYTTEGMHGYFLNHSDQARRIIEQVASDNLFLHLDVYHMQMLEGHLAETLRANVDLLRHVQIAGVPGRHEPSVGEIHYPYLFNLLDELGYDGWVGCEYRPLGKTLDGLGWAEHYGIGGASVASPS